VTHRSRVGVFLIDTPEPHHVAATAFWEAATGRRAEQDDEPQYRTLGLHGEVSLALQRVGAGAAPRVHLDIETDDVDAETARLLGLGAIVVTRNDGWVVLADVAGMPFCVVPVQTGEAFDRHATTWP